MTGPVGPASGESPTAFTLPATTSSPAAAPRDREAIRAAGEGFLRLYWQPPAGMTYGELADALEPYATPAFAALWREPARAHDAAQRVTVVSFTADVASVAGDRAVVAGRAVIAGGGPELLALNLVHGPDGAWRAESFV